MAIKTRRPAIPILTRLVDAQAMHAEHPDTFDAPTAHELATITPGTYIKVSRNNERFWMMVEGGTGRYLIASVQNQLLMSQYEPGTMFRVEPRHVFIIDKPARVQ